MLLLDPETMKYSQSTDEGASEEPERISVWVTVDAGGPQLADRMSSVPPETGGTTYRPSDDGPEESRETHDTLGDAVGVSDNVRRGHYDKGAISPKTRAKNQPHTVIKENGDRGV